MVFDTEKLLADLFQQNTVTKVAEDDLKLLMGIDKYPAVFIALVTVPVFISIL